MNDSDEQERTPYRLLEMKPLAKMACWLWLLLLAGYVLMPEQTFEESLPYKQTSIFYEICGWPFLLSPFWMPFALGKIFDERPVKKSSAR